MDIDDATAFSSSVRVRTGNYDEIVDNDIVIVTAGKPQVPGQKRSELLGVNGGIIQSIARDIVKNGAQPYIILISNPVDVLTHIALEASGLPKNRVFGTGTTLDTARLRVMLSEKLNIADNEILAYILGEHGDSSFPALSGAICGGVPLHSLPGAQDLNIEQVTQDIRDRAYRIIDTKKSTFYGIGQSVTQIVKALLHSSTSIMPVCSLAQGEYGLHEVVISLPCRIDTDGVSILEGYPLNDDEYGLLQKSAAEIADAHRSFHESSQENREPEHQDNREEHHQERQEF